MTRTYVPPGSTELTPYICPRGALNLYVPDADATVAAAEKPGSVP